MTETDEKVYTLNALDRCDGCSAQAYVHVKGVSGELYFCGHHYINADKESLKHLHLKLLMNEISSSRIA